MVNLCTVNTYLILENHHFSQTAYLYFVLLMTVSVTSHCFLLVAELLPGRLGFGPRQLRQHLLVLPGCCVYDKGWFVSDVVRAVSMESHQGGGID